MCVSVVQHPLVRLFISLHPLIGNSVLPLLFAAHGDRHACAGFAAQVARPHVLRVSSAAQVASPHVLREGFAPYVLRAESGSSVLAEDHFFKEDKFGLGGETVFRAVDKAEGVAGGGGHH